MKVKTILSNDKPSETLSIYVDQSFSFDGDEIDQYAMIDHIMTGTSTIIIGEGGGGKSMFMRYLWLSFFERAVGKIPFFLELRNLNNFSHQNFADFIYHSIVRSGSKIRQSEISDAIRNGEIVLFLDGFDEINFEKRDAIQQMILDLKETNPDLLIVVTSRSDPRFTGWSNFVEARVKPLTRENSKLLIKRADYDEELKGKFLAKFDQLFRDHPDFLSNPLLAYMMLVTFSFNPDIPKRMFQFYDQAFEALYHRHDLTKGYKRSFHCTLDKIEFVRLTSFFCLKTYYDERFEFSEIEALEVIKQVAAIEEIDIRPSTFLDDLVQSVCLLKVGGLMYTFTHRSFQEYFAAYCIARVAVRNIEHLFSRFSKRYSDRVLPMVFDMNPELFREKYLIPTFQKHSNFFEEMANTDTKDRYESFGEYVGVRFKFRPAIEAASMKGSIKGSINGTVRAHVKRGSVVSSRINPSTPQHAIIGLEFSTEFADFISAIRSVGDNQVRPDARTEPGDVADHEFALAALKAWGPVEHELSLLVKDGRLALSDLTTAESRLVFLDEIPKLRAAFERTYMRAYINDLSRRLSSFLVDQAKRHDQVSVAFSDLF